VALEATQTPTGAKPLLERIQTLPDDERAIVETLIERLELGRRHYGPWIVADGREYPSEAFAEVIDCLHYSAAELLRLRRLEQQRRRRVYVCHPYSADPLGNTGKVRRICRQLVFEGALPIAPQLFLPAFIDEGLERELALTLCLEFVDLADELGVFDTHISTGMGLECDRAKSRQIPIRNRKRGEP
jgi:hypothetical protein